MALPELTLPDGTPPFLAEGHAIELAPVYADVPMRTGHARRRRIYTTAPRTVQVALQLTAAQMLALHEWFEGPLEAGAQWFSAQVAKQGSGLLWWKARFVEPYEADAGPSAVLWRVTARLLLVGDGSASSPYMTAMSAAVTVALSGGAALTIPIALDATVTVALVPILVLASAVEVALQVLPPGLPYISGLRPVMQIGGLLYAAADYAAMLSQDDGASYYTETDGTMRQVYTAGTRFVDAKLGSQRICVGTNDYANLSGMIVGTDTVAEPTTVYENDSYTQDWTVYGYPRTSGGAVISVGALFSDGSYYYIVGRLADNSQTSGNMYLYRADSSLSFVLQGQLTQDGSDPNALAANGYGAFKSWWFVPDHDSYQSRSVLQKSGSRWLLSSSYAIYYTDDSAGLTGWRRCPTGFREGQSNPPCAIETPIVLSGSTLISMDVNGAANITVSKSDDNGATWTPSSPISSAALPVGLVAFGSSIACLFYTLGGTSYVAKAASPFTTWTASAISPQSYAPNGGFLVSGPNLVARRDNTLLYSSDAIAFMPAAVSSRAPNFEVRWMWASLPYAPGRSADIGGAQDVSRRNWIGI